MAMNVLPPGSVIGILGSGQLGRMLAIAAARLGFRTHIYSDASGPAFDVASHHTLAPYGDLDALRSWAAEVDVVTYEFENVPLDAANAAAAKTPVRPGVRALEVAQDRLTEKSFIASMGLPVAPFAAVDCEDTLREAASKIGIPAILKTRTLGYDGKGQTRILSARDLEGARAEIGGGPAILEGFVEFTAEVSVLIVRGGQSAQSVTYDIPRNTHLDGILATSTVPGPLDAAEANQAIAIARKIADALDYCGVLAVEMFHTASRGTPLVVNEIAPRVHNSGHWTLDACAVCQFENHIRAVAGWPLADPARHSDAVMTNLIGPQINDWQTLAAEPAAGLHIYGKNEARPGRKMGHITRLSPKSTS